MLITEELEKTLKRAYLEAKTRKHEFITLEHLLFALTFDRVASEILYHCGADLKRLQKDLTHFLTSHVPALKGGEEVSPQYTLGVQHVLQMAAAHVQSAEREEIDGGGVLASLFLEKESHAVFFHIYMSLRKWMQPR